VAFQLSNDGAYEYDNAQDCLGADAGQVYPGGAIIQSACAALSDPNPWELWLINRNNGTNTASIQNYGALLYDDAADCLDADAQQMTDGGAIIQWGCNPHDPYQQWQIDGADDGGSLFQNLGPA